MSAPKSVVKLHKKNGKCEVEYTSSVDTAEYYMFELSRAALKDVGRYLKKAASAAFYNEFQKHTGKAGKAAAIDTKVWSNKNTKYPRLEIGAKSGSGNAFRYWFFFQEFGTSRVKKCGILNQVAQNNVAEIVKIESQYLTYLSDEAARLESLIDEKDEGDDLE